MMIGSRLTFKAIQTAKSRVELRFNVITGLLTTLKKGFNMKDIILAGLFGLIGGVTLALVYVYKTGGF
jgi:hypothetical protein